jgi:hypothetical protein
MKEALVISRSTRRFATPALPVALGLGLCACSGNGDSMTSVEPPPNVAGTWWVNWTLHVLRKSDGFEKQFLCFGTMTFVQGSPTAGTSALSGFAEIRPECAPESPDLSGTISAGGAIQFTTNGPRPPEGPCPGGKNVRFSGVVTTDEYFVNLTARGVATVTCPEFGEHELTYLVRSSRGR